MVGEVLVLYSLVSHKPPVLEGKGGKKVGYDGKGKNKNMRQFGVAHEI